MKSFSAAVAQIETDSDKPSRMILLDLDRQPVTDDDGTTYYIDLYSSDSDIARKLQRALTARRLAKQRHKITATEVEANALEFLVALCAGWGAIAKDGTVTPGDDFSPDAARTMLADPTKADLRAQIDEFVADRANFSKALSKNS